MPRVSVIIPAHEAAATLGATLESVAAQTYSDWEVVVADDGSADGTGALATDALGGRVTVVRNETARGPAAARNLALERATGELVAFLDADDLWLPRWLEAQVGRYDAEPPGVGIVACDARIRADGADLPGTYCQQFRHLEPLTLERVLRRNCIYISALVPREAGDEVGWFDPDLFGTEDHDLWIKILETGRRAVLNREALAVYDRAPGSISSNVARQGLNNQKTYERALARGRLTPRQTRIARQELRYNRAMEAVARAWFERRPRALGGRGLLDAAAVAVTRPGHWGDWIRALRGS